MCFPPERVAHPEQSDVKGRTDYPRCRTLPAAVGGWRLSLFVSPSAAPPTLRASGVLHSPQRQTYNGDEA